MIYIYLDNSTFSDIAKELLYCLNQRRMCAEIVNHVKQNNSTDIYIILGMNDFNSQVVPHNYIVIQLEQTSNPDSVQWFGPTYMNYLRGALEVWDYSVINYKYLRANGISHVKYVPLQYMTTSDHQLGTKLNISDKYIDVLFYGSVNDRRLKIYNDLKSTGINVVYKRNIWGAERDELISKSKVVIIPHYNNNSIMETARLSYLLSNKCIVVMEQSIDPILDRWHHKYVSLSSYDNLCSTCQDIISKYDTYYSTTLFNLEDYVKNPYISVIPYDILYQYSAFITFIPESRDQLTSTDQLPSDKIINPIVNSDDIKQAECEIGPNNELVLKLPKLTDSNLPPVSIVTVTYNRKTVFPMAIRNWQLFDYPQDKLEWVIIDDSDDGTSLSSILPKDKRIKYYKLQTTGRLSIGQKRNYGVEHATNELIVFMDDDDYYYPWSVYARIALLIKYPTYGLVGVTDLDIYDVVNDFSARVKGSLISEASMGFRKSFWLEEKFPEHFSTLGEGYMFTKNRRNQIIKMPSGFNIIALTHYTNYTQNNRSYDKFKNVTKKDNILSVLDTSTKLFIFDLFDKVKRQNLQTTPK